MSQLALCQRERDSLRDARDQLLDEKDAYITLLRRALEALEALLEPCAPGSHEPEPDGKCPECDIERRARSVIADLNERLLAD